MKGKTKKIINTILLLLFVASLVIGFSFSGFFNLGDTSSKLKYDKFKFIRKGATWSTYVNNKEALFNYYPTDVLDIQLSEDIMALLFGKYEIDTTLDANDTFIQSISFSQYELGNMLNFHLGMFVRIGMTANNTFNLPIITCNQSTELVPVIYFKESNETKIYRNATCIIATAVIGEDIIRIKDRILYTILGIIR